MMELSIPAVMDSYTPHNLSCKKGGGAASLKLRACTKCLKFHFLKSAAPQ